MRRRKPLWCYTDTDSYTHTATGPGGVSLRLYDGVWCARTMAGEWRSALWLGAIQAQAMPFLEPVEHVPALSALPGQEALFDA